MLAQTCSQIGADSGPKMAGNQLALASESASASESESIYNDAYFISFFEDTNNTEWVNS